jgi:hypothetical protein
MFLARLFLDLLIHALGLHIFLCGLWLKIIHDIMYNSHYSLWMLQNSCKLLIF